MVKRFSWREIGTKGLTLAEASRILRVGISYAALSRLFNNKSSLTPQMALKLSQLLNHCVESQPDHPEQEDEKTKGELASTYFHFSSTLPAGGSRMTCGLPWTKAFKE